jgi:hypothetical protein
MRKPSRLPQAAVFIPCLLAGAVAACGPTAGSVEGPGPGVVREAPLQPAAPPDSADPGAAPQIYNLGDAEVRMRAAATEARVAWPMPDIHVQVLKGVRLLILRSGDRVVRSYPIALGSAPEGDKEREGDGRTPEGEFYVCTRNDRSRYHLFLGISYPSREDAERGLRGGLVDREQHNAIVDANARRARPPWDTGLGGMIGIHGHGSQGDWTLGCVAVEDSAIEELWLACPLGTSVVIEK